MEVERSNWFRSVGAARALAISITLAGPKIERACLRRNDLPAEFRFAKIVFPPKHASIYRGRGNNDRGGPPSACGQAAIVMGCKRPLAARGQPRSDCRCAGGLPVAGEVRVHSSVDAPGSTIGIEHGNARGT